MGCGTGGACRAARKGAPKMMPTFLDILSARIQLRNCNDMRPCVVIYLAHHGTVSVAYISSQPDLCDNANYFSIPVDHPNFRATGLTRHRSRKSLPRQSAVKKRARRNDLQSARYRATGSACLQNGRRFMGRSPDHNATEIV